VEENDKDSMKKIVLGTMAAFVATLICTGGAAATDMRTLSQFILVCNTSSRSCHGNLEDYLRAARDQGFVCPPQDLSLEQGASQELSWLRMHHDSDPTLNNGNVEDAQWTAINALWPCKKDDAPAPN
jgi:hypothetical protein